MSVNLPMPRLRTLSLMPTYRCNASCKSCGTLSSPHVKTRLSEEQVTSVIDEAHDAGIDLVVFTGGEATLELGMLFAGLERAHAKGMQSRLVTNAHWASSEADTHQFLQQLRDAGLDEINFSTGDQHVRFVAVENVLRAVRGALHVGFTPAVMVETTAASKVTRAVLEENPYQVETRTLYPGRAVKFSESPWMPLQPNRKETYPVGMAVDASNLSRTRGCDSVLDTITVQADGNIGACCGLGMRLVPELNVGKIGEKPLTAAIEEAESDVIKRWIRAEGPERILAWAAEIDPSIRWEGLYAHRCQACLRMYKDETVRKVIAEHYLEKIPDVLFAEYLLYGLQLTLDEDPASQPEVISEP